MAYRLRPIRCARPARRKEGWTRVSGDILINVPRRMTPDCSPWASGLFDKPFHGVLRRLRAGPASPPKPEAARAAAMHQSCDSNTMGRPAVSYQKASS